MMRLNRLNLSIVIALAAMTSVYANPEPPPLDKGVPSSYALPKGFKAPDKKSKDGEAFGFTKCKGTRLEKHEGTVPFYVYQASKKSFPNGTLKIGDVILAVNGKLLGAEGSNQIKAAVKEGKKGNGIWLTRWRPGKKRGQGTIERCYLPLIDASTVFDLTKRPIPGPTRDWRLGPLGANGAYNSFMLLTTLRKASAKGKLKSTVYVSVGGLAYSPDTK